ncbi:MAG: ADP-ribosylglycohydrolase family protein [Candidatus Ranarchaeia archaeon]
MTYSNVNSRSPKMKAYASLQASAYGDAMGVPVEFLHPYRIKSYFGKVTCLNTAPPDHPHHKIPLGSVSDDTLQTLMIGRALVKRSLREISMRIVHEAWRNFHVEESPLQLRFMGPSTRQALQKIMEGESPRFTGTKSSSCGSAMRISPLGIYFSRLFDLDQLIQAVTHFTYPTHQAHEAIAGASAIAAAVAQAMQPEATIDDVLSQALEAARKGSGLGVPVSNPSVYHRLRWIIRMVASFNSPSEALDEIVRVIGNGLNVAEAVPFAFAALLATDFQPRQTIIKIINRGGDADSVAAMAGAVAGAFKGVSQCPKDEWKRIQKQSKVQARENPSLRAYLPLENNIRDLAKRLVSQPIAGVEPVDDMLYWRKA